MDEKSADLDRVCSVLREASRKLASATAGEKNRSLAAVMKAIDEDRKLILEANRKDVEKARAGGMKESLVDRLALSDVRINGIIDSIAVVINQADPVGQGIASWISPEGLEIRQVRVPLGVAAIIYESRPNVTVDAFALAYKSGNAILLRGSSSALESNRCLTSSIKRGLAAGNGIPDAVALADSGNRSDVEWILNARGKIDVVLPRGGADLIRLVVDTAKVPVIETGTGVCHLYIDKTANLEMAVRIAANGKLQRPGVCNALETLLVHRERAAEALPALAAEFLRYERETGLSSGTSMAAQFRCDPDTLSLLPEAVIAPDGTEVEVRKIAAEPEDFGTEFLDYILAIKAVDSIEEAVEHINKHNTFHSETIITEERDAARYFQREVDAACVYVNASTRFTDGGVFGFGAELGISTQKMHVRGPMGLAALTTTKYLIDGEGQIR
ncbi:MAG: glutamate-5-semialdehyde dehydrogenase [Spirochaetaceae bacterium]|jgi:glutamate-5-semialdehyde dehydrogenase|nr:glutamate-5-semialdehyde dehydrogenase [Spirochaetaceae bacterium]